MALVDELFPSARERLIVVRCGAPVTEAAALLGDTAHRLVVVCGEDGGMAGVIARADIVREVPHCLGQACTMVCKEIMTEAVVTCRLSDPLERVWKTMTENGLRSVPIVDRLYHPLGVATARDVASVMLSEAAHDQTVIRDYVMSVGYR